MVGRMGLGLWLGGPPYAGGGAPTTIPINARIVQIGDSNTQYGVSSFSSSLSNSANGELQRLASLGGQYSIDVFANDNSTNPGWQGANAGIAGTTYANISGRLPKVMEYNPHVVIVAGGTNDGADSTAAGIAVANNYITMAQAAKDAGAMFVIIRAIPALAGAQFSTVRHQGRLSFLSTVQDFAAANAWCKVADIYTGSIQGTGEAIAGYLQADGLHLTPLGAYMNALVYKAVLDSITTATTNSLVANHQTGTLTPSSGFLSGTAGVLSNVTGTAPTGWTITQTGTSTVTSTLEANAETGGQSVVLAITPAAGTGTDTVTFTPTTNLASVANQWYMVWCEVEVDGTSTNIAVPGSSGGFTTFQSASAYPTGAPQFIRTPPAKATGATKPTITISISKGGVPRTVKIKRVMMVPVTSPYVAWNVNTAPVNTVAPTATGTNGTGNVVTINHGTWAPMTTGSNQERMFKIDYYRDFALISTTYSGSATSTYTQVAADVGATMDFVISAANQSEVRSATASVRFNTNAVAPTLVSAQAAQDGTAIALTYSEPLDPASVPSAGDFAITNSGGTDTPSSVAISGAVCTITKSRATLAGDTITLNYTPGANPIQDLVGNDAAALTAQAVTVVSTADVIVRLTALGAQVTESGNGTTGWNYTGSGVGFSVPQGAASAVGVPANQDGYFVATAPAGNLVLSFKLTASAGAWNSGTIGAYGGSSGSAYTRYGSNGTTVNALNVANNDKIRITRTGTNATFDVQRNGSSTWTTVFSWTGLSTAKLFCHAYLVNNNANNCTNPMGSANVA